MNIAKVIGTIVSTKKDERMIGCKLQIIQPLDLDLKPSGEPQVAVDTVGAGVGEVVLIAKGTPAARALAQPDAPVDCAIVAILDTIEVEGRRKWSKSG